jgi:hypothetical protein
MFNNVHLLPYSTFEVDLCPHCHYSIKPNFISTFFDKIQSKNFSIWQCTSYHCGKSFIISHILTNNEIEFEGFLNGMPKGPNWPQPILELKNSLTLENDEVESSKFITTYLQSLEAESRGLTEIAGMGFRKSIEYLIKDWAIQNNPAKKDDILNNWLAHVINNYYEGDLKSILDRATWLGNDQSHYLKLFQDFDLSNLKELIDLILVELDRDFKKKHYIQSIEKRK